ncbi:gliding motility-associated C-terminal domain-containing protein [Reichenbachiella ulvae]|uniref:Gliding motility-associated C-terminal domain-containing protein n=1 Tax=Reichenbachiella ulvae TaxID=2980104 RepID=A0ABT3CPP1_9BACT|nr:gliding motility-associated C-terminal domain-containing protein [Reichenbachiella ulvae]MCV9385425.1 gliding motility-associated C-terminal domain-containing protein [Reichenbachiella ulvae]
MNSYRKIIFILPLLCISLIASAQEICDDGIDNDNDGFIDCYDGDCSGDAQCLEFYFGNAINCESEATSNPTFDVRLQWGSDDETAFNTANPAVGDIDGDGTPEVVVTNRENNTLTILDGATGSTQEGPRNVGFDIAHTVAIANLRDDDCGEIFVRGFKNGNLAMYDCELNQMWATTSNTGDKVGLISLADFDGDGVVELLHGNEIRNAHTGAVIIAGTGDFRTEVPHGTVAIDALPDGACTNCQGLEIVAGGKIYSVNIATATRTLERDINDILPADGQYAIKYNDWNFNSSSVTDYNLDGNVDVIFSGGQFVSGNLWTTVFFWDVTNNGVLTYNLPENHDHATGRINIADIDGDGSLNCTFNSKQRIYALDENMQEFWIKDVNEGTSGFSGSTVFDFDGDGAHEIVYRGEDYIHIIDGSSKTSLKTISCTSQTFEEYPLVADVDGDGQTEICVACSTDNNTPVSPYENGKYGQIRVYESNGENWQPSRAVWNQHAYFNVNVNDDLTIPITQQDMTKIFQSCEGSTNPENRPLNNFLGQSPYLDETGCPSFVSPDIELVSITNVGSAACPEVNFNVSVTIQNAGDVVLAGNLPITFYEGAPNDASSTKLNTVVTSISGFDIGESMTITAEVEGTGGDFDLYVSVNDDGTQDVPVASFFRPLTECEDNNNIDFVAVTSQTFDIQHEIISHNAKCDPTKPNNGDARVYYFGTTSETSEVVYEETFDDLTPGTEVDNGTSAWSFTETPNNADNLEVSNTGLSFELFFADTDGEAVWETAEIDISSYQSVDFSIDLKSSASAGSNDYLRVYSVIDGNKTSLTDGLQSGNFGTITATGSGAGTTMKIVAEVRNNSDDEFYYLDNVLVEGVTDAQSGEITAGFDFYWFQANNFNDTIYTGNRIATLASGTYQVVAASQTNSCVSAVEEIVITTTTDAPVVEIVKTQDFTNCGSPDGILDAYVIENGVQVTDGYTFTWYIGNDFTTVQSVGSSATGLLARTYSVVVTDNTSGCETTASEDVTTSVTLPVISVATLTNVTDCISSNGEIKVETDQNDVKYTFYWYDGQGIKATPDYSGTGNAGSGASGQFRKNLAPGWYTVVAQHTENPNPTFCYTEPIMVEVLDESGAPELSVDVRDNQSCSENGSGSATATVVGGDTEDYTFHYYSGSSVIAENEIFTVSGTNNQTALLLDAGQYLVTATDASNCTGRLQFTVEDDISYPTNPTNTDDIVIVPAISCNGTVISAGSIDASALSLDAVDTDEYEVVENGSFEVPDTKDPANAAFVEAGGPIGATNWFYIDQANTDGWSTYNDRAGEQYSNVIEIHPNGFNGGFQAYEGQQWAEINAHYFGTLYFDVVTKPGIRMSWGFAHRARRGGGEDVVALLIDDVAVGDAGTEIGRFSSDNSQWNYFSGDYTIPDGQTSTRFQFKAISSATNNELEGNLLDGIVFEVAEYYYELYQGGNSSGTPIAENTTAVFEGLDPGTYTISVVNNISGCPAEDITVLVEEADQEPVTVKQLSTSDEYCVGGNGTQNVVASTNPLIGEPVNGYDFTIYTGTDITATPYAGPITDMDGDYTFTGLANGSYTILVANNDNNCDVTTTTTIGTNSVDPIFATPIISDQSNCSGTPNGFASARIFGESKEDYTWSWTDISDNPITGKTSVDASVDGTANTISGMAAGTYKVTAFNTETGCSVGPEEVTIGYTPIYPSVNLNEVAANTGCTIGNGSLEAFAVDGGLNTQDNHTFEWYIGSFAAVSDLDSETPLTDGDDAGNGSVVALSGTNNSTISGLNAPSGNATYTVKVTKTDGGCANISTITLSSAPVAPIVTSATAVVTPVNSCIGSTTFPEGEIEIIDVNTDGSFTDQVNDYTYTWRIGGSTGTIINDGDNIGTLKGGTAAAITVADATTNHIKNLDAGTYYVSATNTATGCASAYVTVEVTESLASITLGENPGTDQTACTGDPTGSTEITATSAAGTDTFSFEFFNGQNTDAANQLPIASDPNLDQVSIANASGSTAAQISALPQGTYTALVTNEVTGCTDEIEFTIDNNLVDPIIDNTEATDVTITEVTQCSGSTAFADGQIQLNDVTGAGFNDEVNDYTYRWYIGNSNTGTQITDGTDIETQKGNTPIATVAVAGATTNHIQNISAGLYTVEAINNTTGCTSATVTIEMTENLLPITMTETPISDQISCTDAYTGETQINATNTDGDTFNFEFFIGTSTNAADKLGVAPRNAEANYDQVVISSASASNAATIAQLPGGTYTAMVTNTTTGCTEELEFTIDNNPTDPVIDNADAGDITVTPVNVCSGGAAFANGQIQLNDVTGGGFDDEVNDYTYRWYIGNSNTGTQITNGSDIETQKGVTPASNTNVTGATSNHIQNLSTGFYTVEAVNSTTGCISATVTIEVTEDLLPITMTETPISDQISCTDAYTGETQINASNTNGDTFNFEFFVGSSTNAADKLGVAPRSGEANYDQVVISSASSSNAATIEQLPGGVYTALVTNTTTGCTEELEFTIDNNPTDPVIDNTEAADVTITPVTVCSGVTAFANGEIQLNDVTGGGFDDEVNDYTYRWYIGNSNTGTQINNGTNIETQKGVTPAANAVVTGATSNHIQNLSAGLYTVEAVNTTTGCISATVTLEVTEDLLPITMTETPISDQISCTDAYTGETQINATNTDGDTFNFEFFIGTSTNAADKLGVAPRNAEADYNQVVISGASVSNAATIEQLPGGTYTARVTNTATGCTEELEFTIDNNPTDPVIDNADAGDITVTPVNVCSGGTAFANGQIQLNDVTGGGFDDEINDYTYRWYIGNSNTGTQITNGSDIETQKGVTPASNTNVTGATSNHIQNLSAGFYTVEAVNSTTGCISATVTVEVTEDLLPITMTETPISDQISCTDAFTGETQINASNTNGDTFNFEFFIGSSTNAADKLGVAPRNTEADYNQVVISSASASNAATIEQLPGGTYTARVTNTTTGCTEELEFTIDNNPTDPVIDNTEAADVNITHVTVCTGATTYPNGAIELTDVTGGGFDDEVNDYTYRWYIGNSNTGTQIDDLDDIETQKGNTAVTPNVSGSSTNHIQNLSAGLYTVEAVNNTTGCISATVTIEVEDQAPTFTFTAEVTQDNFTCDSSNPIGQVTANIDAADNSGYTIEWYRGTNTLSSNLLPAALASASGTTDSEGSNHIIDGLPQGTYTVKVIHDASQCFETQEVTIRRAYPIFTVNMSQTAQNECLPANGIARVDNVSVTYSDGGTAPIGYTPSYTYAWYQGESVAGTLLSQTTAELTEISAGEGLETGYYTVVVTDNNSSCSSNATRIEVLDNTPARPTADLSVGVIPSSCKAAGDITADLATNPGGNNIAFEWYEGTGDYDVDPSSGTPLTDGGTLTDTDFTVSITSTTGGLGTATTTIDGIAPGLYTVVMIDQTSGCRTQQVFDLPYIGQQATTTIAIKHVEECPDNGEATVGLADNVSIAYTGGSGTFEDGENVTSTGGATGIVNSDDGSTLVITTTSGDFINGENVTGDNSGATTSTSTTVTDGYIDGQVDDISEYTIYLYAGAGVPADKFATYTYEGDTYPKTISGAGLSPGDEVTFTGLPAGTYTAVAQQISNPAFAPGNTDQCFSAYATDAIDQRAFEPILDSSSITANTNCDEEGVAGQGLGGDGSISATVIKYQGDSTLANDFQFRWYIEGSESPGDEIQTNDNVLTSTANDLGPGTYVLQIERMGLVGPAVNGCMIEETFVVPHEPVEQQITATDITPITNCGGTGSIEVTGITSGNVGDYTFTWHQGTYGTTLAETGATLSGVAAGTYFVEARLTGTGSDGCATSPIELEIEDNTVLPDIVFTVDQLDSYCGDAITGGGDGQITANVNGQSAGDYTFEWFYGSGTSTTLAASGIVTQGTSGTNGQTATGLPQGTYTVRVTDNTDPNQTCLSTKQITLSEDLPILSVTASQYTLAHNTNCTDNGSFQINDVLEDGAAQGLANYTFLFEVAGGGALPGGVVASSTGAATDDNRLDNLPTGDYQVTITNDVTTCASTTVSFSIDDNTVDPNIVFTVDQLDTYCGDATTVGGNGQITASVSGEAAADYTFEWFYGTGTGTTLAASGIPTQGTSGTNGQTATGLPQGTYTVRVTDNTDPNNTCVSTKQISLSESLPIVTVTASQYTLNHNTNCTDNGSFQINDVLENSIAQGLAGYTFNFQVAGGGALPAGVTASTTGAATSNNRLDNLPTGDYQVTITNNTTECASTTVVFSIEDNTVDPNIVFTVDQLDTYCGDATTVGGNGQITASVSGEAAADYTFEWFYGTGTGTTLAASGIPTQGTSGTNGQTATGLPQGTYTVRVTDNTDPNNTCVSTKQISLSESLPIVTVTASQYTLNHNTNCTDNGSFQINDVLENSIAQGLAGYTFNFQVAGGGALPAGVTASTTGAATSNNRLDNLPTGDYQVSITNNTTECASTTVVFSIDDNTVDPNIVFTVDQLDAYCGDATSVGGTGQITASVSGEAAADYTFEWFYGAGTGTTLATSGIPTQGTSGTNGQTATGLPQGTYTVRVTDNTDPNNTCVSTKQITLSESLPIVTVTASQYTLNHNTNCTDNGSFQINDVLENSIAQGLAGYTFNFQVAGGGALPAGVTASTTGAATSNNRLDNLPTGDYQVTITNNTTECASTIIAFSIEDNTVDPDIVFTVDQLDSYCGDAATVGGTGQITASVSGNSELDYTFEWFYGSGTTTTLAASGIPTQGTSGTNGQTATGLPQGTYTVRVTDNTDPNNTCVSTKEITLQENTPVLSITDSEYSLVHNTNCTNENGTFEITSVLEDGIAQSIANYSFDFASEGGGALPAGVNETISGLAVDNNGLENLPAGNYQVTITNTTSQCTSSTVVFTIDDNTIAPTVTATTTADTYCVLVSNEGTGTLTITGGSATDYTYTWYKGTGTTDLLSANLGTTGAITNSGLNLTGLATGSYTVVVTDNNATDNNFGCTTTATFQVENDTETHTITEANVTGNINHVVDCGGSDGSITINNADVTSGDVNDYTFAWYTANPTVLISGESSATLLNREPGDYLVVATHNVTGCSTGQVAFEILDNSVAPEVTITVNSVDTSCDPDANEGNGALDWTITNDDGGNYTYQWYAGASVASGVALTDNGTIAGTSGGGVTSGTLSGIDGGAYVLLVTDNATPSNSCFVEATLLDSSGDPMLLEEDIPVFEISTVNKTENTNCINPNGEFEITGITSDGTAAALTDFTFTIQTSTGAAHGGTDVGNGHVSNLSAGRYQVIIEHISSECAGSTYEFSILDESMAPTLTFNLDQANEYCVGGNGQLTITTNATSPTIVWDHGPTTTTVSGLESQEYTVTVTDGVTGCVITDSYTVPFEPIDIQLSLTTDVIMTPATTCAPANGSIELTNINPDALSDYTYFLHTGTYTSGAGTNMGTTPVFTGLAPNMYYIEAYSNISGCMSDVFQIEVEDETAPPVVALADFDQVTNCDPTNPNGMLTVTADGSTSTTDYRFQWLNGPNDPTYAGIDVGSYTIEVENLATGCITTEVFGMSSIAAEPLLLNVSTTGNENCVDPNGMLAISVTNSTNETAVFEYYMVAGEEFDEAVITQAANNLNGNTASELEHGTYSIVVLDVDGGCSSDPNIIQIEDKTNTMMMEMIITQDHALTKCDLTRADGQATVVSVPDEPSRYTFTWHDGPSLSDPVLDSAAFTVHQLIDKTYTVHMVDRYTGCDITDQITITNETEEVPLPTINVLSDRTNCLTPNGVLRASVNEVTTGYTFEWTDVTNTTISNTILATGLDEGSYSVQATDTNTGCVSDAATAEVVDERVTPKFSVKTTDSQCNELIMGTNEYVGNGSADLVFTTPTIIEDFYWTMDDGTAAIDTADYASFISRDERLSGIGPNSYQVMVIDENDCASDVVPFEISTEIKIFNAVTDNGDALNDYFRITCADRFPNNKVKIFNRSGTLVYEIRWYEDDVNGRVFTGKSNTGLGGGKQGLPPGTYFYIFDKGEGQEGDVTQGYLELLR